MKTLHVICIYLILISFCISQDVINIKFATVAPEGSTWMTVMHEFNKDVQNATGGKVKFKIYPGMIQGDEKDVLRKIRINQLHSGGFTGFGLGEILPEVRILDSPFLFRNHEEVDFVANKFFDRFAENFEKKGYILLGWAEVGFVNIYTNRPVQNAEDMKGVKMWMWEGDPLAEATFKAFGISPIPLSITDVLTSLQTGLIDGVYTAPLACIGLQWFTKTKYFIDIETPLTNSMGAALISKKMFYKLDAEQQKILKEKGKQYFDQLTQLTRKDNVDSINEMIKAGIERIEINDPETVKSFESIGKQARQALVGKLYDQDLLDEIENTVLEYRAN
jgi:TRAP-type C4-dicarboxylate transport system substrate-binding protein